MSDGSERGWAEVQGIGGGGHSENYIIATETQLRLTEIASSVFFSTENLSRFSGLNFSRYSFYSAVITGLSFIIR